MKSMALSLPPTSLSAIDLQCQNTRCYGDASSDLRPGEKIVISPYSRQNKGDAKKSKITPKRSPPFVDKIRLRVRGGMGGAGEIYTVTTSLLHDELFSSRFGRFGPHSVVSLISCFL